MKYKHKYYDIVLAMRKKKNTLQEIAKVVGRSRERVRQVEKIIGLEPRGRTGPRKGVQIKKICNRIKCKQIFFVTPSNKHIKYCSRKCWLDNLPIGLARMTPEQKKVYWLKKSKRWYRNNKDRPEIKERIRNANKLYKLRHKHEK